MQVCSNIAKRRKVGSVWSLLFLFLPPSLAATPVDTLTRRFTLDEVSVSAALRRDVIAPQALTDSSLRRMQSLSVADAVRYFSGVQLKDYGGIGGLKTLDIRSMGSHHLGVSYDGIEIGNAQNGIVDLGRFSLDNLSAIDLYNGVRTDILQSARDYGSSSMLYLTSRAPQFRDGKTYHVEARLRAGTFALVSPSVLYQQRLTDHLSLSLNAEYSRSSGRYHFRYSRQFADGSTAWDTTAIRRGGDMQSLRLEAALHGVGDLGQGSYRWNVRGYYYQSERGIPGPIVNNVFYSGQRQWDRNGFVQAFAQLSPLRRLDIQLRAKYANDYLRYLDPDPTHMRVDQHYLQQEVYLSAAARYRIFPIWDVSLAADYGLEWLRTDKRLTHTPVRHTLMVSAATSVQYRWIRAMASVLETHIFDVQDYNAVTPSLVFSTQPILSEDWIIRAFYKMAYRMPTFNDLYYQDYGIADLRPERTRQYDLGSEWSHRFPVSAPGLRAISLRLRVDAYFNQVDNKIIAVPKGNSQFRWAMMNLGYVEILGTEPAFDFTLHLGRELDWTTHGTYTFSRALDRTDPTDNDPYFGTYNRQIAYIPRHAGSVSTTFAWRGLSLTYSYLYTGARYSSSAHTRQNYIQPYYTHDFAASYRLPLRRLALLFGLEVNNILNQHYEVIPSYPMPGTNGKASITVIL